MSGKVFSGNLRLAPVDANGVVQGGFLGLLNTVKCELAIPAPTKIQQISTQIGTDGQVKSEAQRQNPTALNVTIDDLDDQRVLAYALNGITAAYAQVAASIAVQTGGTITDEAVTASSPLGTPVALANRQVSAVVVKNTAGSTTYVVNTDYTVDAASGTITALTTGTITAGQSLKVSYTAAALSGETVTIPATLGDWVPLANRAVSNVVLKNSGGSTTYVNGTDYLVDATAGFILPLKTGAITAGSSIKATYTAAALSGSTVYGGAVTSSLLRIEVQLENLVDNATHYFVCPLYKASSSGNLDLFGKNMLTAALGGSMLLPPVGTKAYTDTQGKPFAFTALTS